MQPRLMKGHIQSRFRYKEEGYDYSAFEMAFPAFPAKADLRSSTITIATTLWA